MRWFRNLGITTKLMTSFLLLTGMTVGVGLRAMRDLATMAAGTEQMYLKMAKPMASLRFQDWLPAENVFLEEEVMYSSTIKAVRRAYELIEENACAHCRQENGVAADKDALYYLV